MLGGLFVLFWVCVLVFLIQPGTDKTIGNTLVSVPTIPFVGVWELDHKAVGHTYGHLEQELTTLFSGMLVNIAASEVRMNALGQGY